MSEYDREIKEASLILARSTKATALCGAGVSAESDISTFRDPGGLWERIDPFEIGTPEGLINTLKTRSKELIPLFLDILNTFERAKPNDGHIAMAELERMGILKSVINYYDTPD